jgi:hypothetical protein
MVIICSKDIATTLLHSSSAMYYVWGWGGGGGGGGGGGLPPLVYTTNHFRSVDTFGNKTIKLHLSILPNSNIYTI